MSWTRGPYTSEMIDEPVYSFRAADNARAYEHELLLESEYPLSKHGLHCFLDGVLCGSAVVDASGGATGRCALPAGRIGALDTFTTKIDRAKPAGTTLVSASDGGLSSLRPLARRSYSPRMRLETIGNLRSLLSIL